MNDAKPDQVDKPKDEKPKKVAMYVNPLAKGKYRNAPCVCGSGKKIKKCHGRDHAIDVLKLNEINRLIDKNNKAYEAALKDQWEQANKDTHNKAP